MRPDDCLGEDCDEVRTRERYRRERDEARARLAELEKKLAEAERERDEACAHVLNGMLAVEQIQKERGDLMVRAEKAGIGVDDLYPPPEPPSPPVYGPVVEVHYPEGYIPSPPCPRCGGSGNVSTIGLGPVLVDCPQCGGKGR